MSKQSRLNKAKAEKAKASQDKRPPQEQQQERQRGAKEQANDLERRNDKNE